MAQVGRASQDYLHTNSLLYYEVLGHHRCGSLHSRRKPGLSRWTLFLKGAEPLYPIA